MGLRGTTSKRTRKVRSTTLKRASAANAANAASVPIKAQSAWEALRRQLHEPSRRGVSAGLAARVLVSGQERLCETVGMADIENKKPFTRRTLVRLYSMTKCVIAVGLFQLMEKGHLSLDDLLSDHIPAFRNVRVATIRRNGMPNLVRTLAPREAIRIRHLLTHTSGISSGLAPGLDGPRIRKAKERAWAGIYEPLVRKIDADGFPNLGAWVSELASLPLIEQTGTHYGYGYSYDILGHIVELKSGKPLAQYLRDHVFRPLGMNDTVFDLCDGRRVPRPELKARLSVLYRYTKSAKFGSDGKKARLVRVDPATKSGSSRWAKPCLVPSGGGGLSSLEGGLLSTLDDYTIFLRTLLQGGVHPESKVRILSQRSADLMLADQTAALGGKGRPVPPGCSPYDDQGLGLSCLGELQRKGAPAWGRWFDGVPHVRLWGGAASCAFKYDPNGGKPILAIVMTQVLPQEDGGTITDLMIGARKAVNEEK